MRRDSFGRTWDLPNSELCPGCGQPDNCGDCNHAPLDLDDARSLGAYINPELEGDGA